MVVGPGEASMAIDTLEGIAAFYPLAELWVREDLTSDGTWDKLAEWAKGRPTVHLTRNEKTQGYLGLAKSVCELLRLIARETDVPELVVKIDPDAILLRPGLVEVFRQKFAESGPGLCGSYKIGPDGGIRRSHMHVRMMIHDLLPIGRGNDRKLRTRPVFYLKYLFRALLNGYVPCENVQGGTYGIDGRTLLELDRTGFLSAVPDRHTARNHCEDALISMAARSVGHRLISMNDYPNKVVAWLKALTPLGITPQEAWDRGYVAVHPVKKKDDAIREFFREKRLACS